MAPCAAAVSGGDWQTKCRAILGQLAKQLGTSKDIFWQPVNPQLVIDYYTVIKHPMFFAQIEKRIDTVCDKSWEWENCASEALCAEPFSGVWARLEFLKVGT